ncbi:hypothetical protein N9F42_02210 [Pseudomonadales bacterium]|nr:hypothetical protein [Pseudomonadales bacterium]
MNNPRRHNIHDKFIRAALQNHRKQQWIGPLLTAMKYIRQKNMTNKRLKAPVPVDPYLLPRTFFCGFKSFHLNLVS